MHDQSERSPPRPTGSTPGGWGVGDTAFYVEGGGLVHVVTGADPDDQWKLAARLARSRASPGGAGEGVG
jgi:hypothetical protein